MPPFRKRVVRRKEVIQVWFLTGIYDWEASAENPHQNSIAGMAKRA